MIDLLSCQSCYAFHKHKGRAHLQCRTRKFGSGYKIVQDSAEAVAQSSLGYSRHQHFKAVSHSWTSTLMVLMTRQIPVEPDIRTLSQTLTSFLWNCG